MSFDELHKEAIEIVDKTSKDKFVEAKIRLQALVFMKKYNTYLQNKEGENK